MAELFATAGYATGISGKWHLGDNYPYRPQDRGFHETLWYPSSHIGSAPDYWDNDYFDDTYWHNGRHRRFTGYTTDVFFGEAMRWMRKEARADKPFFCYLPTAAPHAPHFVPDPWVDFFRPLAEVDDRGHTTVYVWDGVVPVVAVGGGGALSQCGGQK